MKNKLKIITILAIGLFLLPTCKKDPDLRMPDLTKSGVVPLIQKDETKDLDISSIDLAGFNGSIVVDLYYDAKPKSMDLMVTMNNNYSNSAVVQANITSFPSTVNFTLANMAELLPGLDVVDSLKPGDYFRFYSVVTLEDGTVINGNDTLYSAYNSSIVNLPGSSLEVTYTVLCPFQPELTVDSYHAVSEAWIVEGDVTFTADGSDPNTIFIEGIAENLDFLVGNGNKQTIKIDPVTYEISGEKTIIAADCAGWGADYAGYTNYAYTPLEGTYNTCDGSYTIKFNISCDQGDFGDFEFIFTRN